MSLKNSNAVNETIRDDQLLSISKFSELTGICRSTLIYYDEIDLFKPMSRGENNYRYYSHRQIITVNLINVMRDLDIPVKVIKALAYDRTPEKIHGLLAEQEKQLKDKVHWLKDAQKIIRTLRKLLNLGMDAEEDIISIHEMDALPLILGPENDFGESASFYNGFLRFCGQAKTKGFNLSYPIGGYFADMDAFFNEPSRPNRFFFVNPDGKEARDAGLYLTGYTRGYYGQTNDLPQRLDDYIREHSLIPQGPVYNIYLFDEISVTDPNQYLLQATVRVSKRT
jgi:DNA-binding transcriptional MerR regulator